MFCFPKSRINKNGGNKIKNLCTNDNYGHVTFFSKFSDSLRRQADMQIVLARDFNCALAPLEKTGRTSTERKKTDYHGFR